MLIGGAAAAPLVHPQRIGGDAAADRGAGGAAGVKKSQRVEKEPVRCPCGAPTVSVVIFCIRLDGLRETRAPTTWSYAHTADPPGRIGTGARAGT